MDSMLFCRRGGMITPVTSGQVEDYQEPFTYIDRDGNLVTVMWPISNEEFLDKDSLTLDEITRICEAKNPGLLERGFPEAIYEMCQEHGLNPKVLLATLGNEQSWCKNGKYDKAFGIGTGGAPESYDNAYQNAYAACRAYLNNYQTGLESEDLIIDGVNCDKGPNYIETKACFNNEMDQWQNDNPKYVEYMEKGQSIECVNAAMYARLRYTPWVDFPPQNSYPLETWLKIYNSLDTILEDSKK